MESLTGFVSCTPHLGTKHRPELLLDLAKHLEKRGDARLLVIAAAPERTGFARDPIR